MAGKYPWYEVAKNTDDLLQGDFIEDCPIIIAPPDMAEKANVDVDILKFNIIVMSQSCDMIEKKIPLVLVCPVYPLNEVGKKETFLPAKMGRSNCAGEMLLVTIC